MGGHPVVSRNIRAGVTPSVGPPLRSSLIPTRIIYPLVPAQWAYRNKMGQFPYMRLAIGPVQRVRNGRGSVEETVTHVEHARSVLVRHDTVTEAQWAQGLRRAAQVRPMTGIRSH